MKLNKNQEFVLWARIYRVLKRKHRTSMKLLDWNWRR